MCHRSLNDRICTRTDCKFMHVKGTKRTDPEENNMRSANFEPLPHSAARPLLSPPSVPVHPPPQDRSSSIVAQTQTSFLSHLSKLEDHLAKMTTKLDHLDSKYTYLSQQQAKQYSTYPPPQYQPLYPHLFPPPMQVGSSLGSPRQ